MKKLFFILLCFVTIHAVAQSKDYTDSINKFHQNYVAAHEVVLGNDKQFISFYPVNASLVITAKFRRLKKKEPILMQTALGKTQQYFIYGVVDFMINDSSQRLFIYQSETLMATEEYADYLFVPFGDATSGFSSYGAGRYLDFRMNEIKSNTLTIDFNKAYNPYCAYANGYDCPRPPVENIMNVAINAGEKNYGKPLH